MELVFKPRECHSGAQTLSPVNGETVVDVRLSSAASVLEFGWQRIQSQGLNATKSLFIKSQREKK